MNKFSETNDLFDRHVPHGELALTILKVHLLVEMHLTKFVSARLNDPNLLKMILDRNSPVKSGKALTLLARSLAHLDQIPLTVKDIHWDAIDKLNSLRNDIAHQLEPNAESFKQKIKSFIIAAGDDSPDMQNLNTNFRDCALLVFAFLDIARDPIVPSDFDEY